MSGSASTRSFDPTVQAPGRQFTDFLEQAAMPVHSVGPDGRILWANAAELRFLGYAREEYIGHHIADFHVDREVIDALLQRLLAGETLLDEPARMRCKDGTIKHVLIHSNGLWENGSFVCTRCFTRDVTAQKHLEDLLRERELMLQLAMRAAQSGTWVRDLRTDKAKWTPELESIFGMAPGSFAGTFQDFAALVHPDDRDGIVGVVQSAIQSRRDFHIEFRFRHASGEWRWMEARGQAVYDEANQPIRMHGIAMDVTQRKQAERAQALWAAIVESSHDAIVSKGLDGRISSWNASATHLFGYLPEEIIGKPITTIIPPELHEQEREIIARLKRGERIEQLETVRVTKDGRRIDVSLTVSPVRDYTGKIIGASKIARDISERKRIEQQLREANRRKDEFLAMLGHELRNPLAPIRNVVEVLRRTAGQSPAQQRMCQLLERQVHHMTRLLDDLLDVSRITQGKIQFQREPLDLLAVVGRAVEAARPLLDERSHRLNVSLPKRALRVLGDLTRLVQMLGNLLNNAAKYTPEGGEISVSVEPRERTVELRVQDNGVGIDPGMLPQIFDLFVQADQSLERSQGGMGIGLTLVRSIVEHHGGTVEARSEGPGRGSEFLVCLPLLDEKQLAPDTKTGRQIDVARPLGGKRVLVVDDNVDAAESLAVILRIGGHQVLTAADGPGTLEAVQAFQPELVLLDIGLPGMNGYEVARRLRERGCTARLVALTGYGQPEDRERSRESGIDHHFVKPIDPVVLDQLLV